ncbi:hypothetical protein SRRS_33390 [Sporomusa rhizae]
MPMMKAIQVAAKGQPMKLVEGPVRNPEKDRYFEGSGGTFILLR